MCVIPVGSGIRRGEIIVEALPRLDRGLGKPRNAIHRIGEANAVPVDGTSLRQFVHEAALQPRTLLQTQLRAGHRAAITPDISLGVTFRRQLNAGGAGVEGLESGRCGIKPLWKGKSRGGSRPLHEKIASRWHGGSCVSIAAIAAPAIGFEDQEIRPESDSMRPEPAEGSVDPVFPLQFTYIAGD